jgi:perosamine synthetase
VSRDLFVEAMRVEGIPISVGYVEPIYLQPLYRQRIAYGTRGCPFTCPHNQESTVSYEKGVCPVAERMYYDEWIANGLIYKGVSKFDLDDIDHAYEKVLGGAKDLKRLCLDSAQNQL